MYTFANVLIWFNPASRCIFELQVLQQTVVVFHQLHNCVSLSHRQLILIIELYNHRDVYDYLRHIALTLCSDKVSEVRWISYKLVRLQDLRFVDERNFFLR